MHFIASTLALASVAFAGIIARQNAVPVPDVRYPHSGFTAVWVVGVRHNVTWDPSNVSGSDSKIWLAKGPVVDTSSPLASGFDLKNGRVELTVPNVEPATDYTVHLDVGGQTASSAPFTITRSKDELPQAQPPANGPTTVVFPGTTIVTNIGGVPSGSAATPAPSGEASASGAESAGASASAPSSPISSAISPSGSGSGGAGSPTAGQGQGSGNGAPAPSQTGNSAISSTFAAPTHVFVAIGAVVFSAALFAF